MSTITIDQAIEIATRHHQAGRLAEAEQLYHQILALDPNHHDALRLLGIIRMQNEQFVEAVELIRRAISIRPDIPIYHVNLGNALKAAGDIDAGIAAYRHAITLKPDYPQAHYNLGVALSDKALHADAIIAYQRALELQPRYREALINLGVALAEIGRTDEAISAYHAALQIKADSADVYVNLGNAQRGVGRTEKAIAAYEQALRLDPQIPEAHYNLATLLLHAGDFARGFAEFEWRWKWKEFPFPWPRFTQPLWDGSDLNGRTILLWHEQGMGDTIQFIRFAQQVAARGGQVIVQCPPALHRLLAGVAGVSQIVADKKLPPFDVHCPMMTLPLALGTRVETIPHDVPYVKVDPALIEQWRSKLLGEQNRVKIGLVWAGSPTNKRDALRSLHFRQFAPLAAVPSATFFSLQKGAAAAQCAEVPAGMKLIDLTGELQDFADTAALISHLDLVITVDTAIAHLAGALGKPVWVLIPNAPDWRWMQEREDSPWYPTMRLFRQKRVGDWENVVERVMRALVDRSK